MTLVLIVLFSENSFYLIMHQDRLVTHCNICTYISLQADQSRNNHEITPSGLAPRKGLLISIDRPAHRCSKLTCVPTDSAMYCLIALFSFSLPHFKAGMAVWLFSTLMEERVLAAKKQNFTIERPYCPL